ncbi:MAG: PspC domain-containing protein [candidate division Zixibacteria bacterium]|nr:PspC domain-containing protein [candidate division Zixibacteria bacterium]
MAKRLYRSYDSRIIGGVCGGLAEYFDIDPTLVRIICVALALVAKPVIIIYIVGWIIIPEREPSVIVEGAESEDVARVSDNSNRGMWFGIILVILGFGFLLDSFSFWYWYDFSKLWPLLLIGLGVLIIGKALSKKKEVEYES